MDSPVNAFQQNDVDLLQQFRDRVDDLDAHSAKLLGEAFDAIAAGWQVGSAGISCDDANPRHVAARLGIVEDLRERRHV